MRKGTLESCWAVFSLTELTDLTEPFCAQFRSHRTPPAYRIHRTLLLMLAVTFCDIGWLNVSVKLCVFYSSVFFCEKKNTPTVRERMLESCRGVFSLTEDISFSHVRYFFLSQSAQSLRSFLAHISSPQKAFGIQSSQRPHPQPLSEWRGE